MSADFRALCADLLWALENAIRVIYHEDGTKHISTANPIVNRARAALADEPAVPEVVGSEWQPCVKLPITVHVREQRPGEQHVSTREGITPVQSDDLIMLGVDGEEYPIGRELFQRTYRMGSADEPAAVTGQPRPTEDDVEDAAQCIYEAMRFERVETTPAWSELGNSLAQDTARKAARAVLARWGHQPAPPADGEVAELVAKLRRLAPQNPLGTADPTITRAADLLERQALVPVSVSDALIKAECALSDIAEGEPMTDEGDPLKWAERRCADTLAIIRPTMMQHKIRTSEWPPVAATAKPLSEVGE